MIMINRGTTKQKINKFRRYDKACVSFGMDVVGFTVVIFIRGFSVTMDNSDFSGIFSNPKSGPQRCDP